MDLIKPYRDGVARGLLVLQRCRHCRHWIHFPEPVCPACGNADFTFEPVSGQGRIETFSVIHRSFVPEFVGREPYVVAWVGLPEQEGLRCFGNIVGCDPDAVAIGLEVELCFDPQGGNSAAPNFKIKNENSRGE